MNIKYFTALFFISLLVSACNSPIEYCSLSETEKAIDDLLTEQAIQLTSAKKNDHYDGASILGTIKIKAAFAQIRISLENIKKVKQGVDGHKSSCSAQLKITVPPPMLSDVDLVRDTQHQLRIIPYAKELHIDNGNNVFVQTIDYSVLTTKGLKTPSVEFVSTPFAHLLDEIVTAVLLKPTLELKPAGTAGLTEPLPSLIIEPVQTQVNVEKTNTIINSDIVNLKEDMSVSKPIELAPKKLPIPEEVTKTIAVETITKPTTPSFNCSIAIKPTDITICHTADLARLDNENMQLYKNARVIDPVMTKDIWFTSIKAKYACKTTVDCIANVYKKSIRDYDCVINKDKASCKVDGLKLK